MNRNLGLLTLLILTSQAANAQPLTMRSGDHETFSRITIPLPQNQDWEAFQTEEGVEISLPGFNRGFDLSSVFVRMRPNRISAIDKQDDQLLFRIECDCAASVFLSGPLLVLDVADRGTDLFGPILERKMNISPQITADSNLTLTERPSLPWIGSNPPLNESRDTTTPSVDTDPSSTNELRAVVLEDVERTLVREISRATSSGLVQADVQQREGVTKPSDDPVELPSVEPKDLPEILQSPSQNVRILPSFDLLGVGASLKAAVANTTMTCPENAYFAVEQWGQDEDFSNQIGAARRSLMDARDNLVKPAVIRLAQTYIYFGFGAEALDVLNLLGEEHMEKSALMSIARILEYGADPSNPVTQLSECETNVALWAIMAHSSPPPDGRLNVDSALRALNRLPQHLRKIIASGLSDRLLKSGDPDAAATALRSIQRLDAPLLPDAKLAQISLEPITNNQLEGVLTDIVQSNGSNAPEALIQLIETKLANNEPIDTDTSLLLDAYIQEFRGADVADTLQKIRVKALAQSQSYGEAFSALHNLAPSLSPSVNSTLQNHIIKRLAETDNDAIFLKQVFRQSIFDEDTLSPELVTKLASRLLSMGFALEAQQILKNNVIHPESKQHQALDARILLTLQQPFQALARIMEVEGPEADLIRAQAMARTGQYKEAYQLYLENGAENEAIGAAWLADNWQEIIAQDTPIFGEMAVLVDENQAQNLSDRGQLENATILLDDSSVVRGVFQRLFNDEIMKIQAEP